MRMKHAIVCLLGGLTLATMAEPASAQPVTYKVDLLYEKIVDGPRPRKTVRVTLRAPSPRVAEFICDNSLLKLSRNLLAENPKALGLTGNWMAGSGQCVRGQDGNVEMNVEASSGGSN
ncbi:MAG: hypothetical protein JWQ22_1460 [Devosia sp.]|nr:hypothetical protein [Devosia sp.]